MSILISFVGDSDPIRGYYDGALLHITRMKRPEKIVLFHSEHSFKRHNDIALAINSIAPDYKPEITWDKDIISNNNVFLFDDMYAFLSNKIRDFQKLNNNIILNLTSGTPQMIAAMFTIVQIKELNHVEAYQVVTPLKRSNVGLGHDGNEDIEALIELNQDNIVDFENRSLLVGSDNFKQSLLRRTFRDLLEVYEFMGAYDLLKHNPNFITNQQKLMKEIKEVTEAIKYQKLLKQIDNLKFPYTIKQLINAYIIIDIQTERELVSEVIIRVQNFAEQAIFTWIKKKQPNLLNVINSKFYFNPSHKLIPEIQIEYKKNHSKGYELDLSHYVSYSVLQKVMGVIDTDGEFNRYVQLLDSSTQMEGVREEG